MIPTLAKIYMPILVMVQLQLWPSAPDPYHLAGMIEQETCISLSHSKCWNPKAELKTSREYGFGLGQFTTAYRSDGAVRFNKQQELSDRYSSLRDWTFERRFDANYQITALVEMTRGLWNRVHSPADNVAHWAFTFSAYNGGMSHVQRDRLLCGNTNGCDPSRWFDNVELHSVKSRQPWRGYGRSPYQINREHVYKIIKVRSPKYATIWSAV